MSLSEKKEEDRIMKIAIPTAQGKLCMHFGHCEVFTFIDVDEATKQIIKTEAIQGPEHAPGVIPQWVAKQGANLVIAGGMGAKAIELFSENNVKVVAGAVVQTPQEAVVAYLNGTLKTSVNGCNHDHGGCGGH